MGVAVGASGHEVAVGQCGAAPHRGGVHDGLRALSAPRVPHAHGAVLARARARVRARVRAWARVRARARVRA